MTPTTRTVTYRTVTYHTVTYNIQLESTRTTSQ